ncbi:MAG: diguanylate cyclase [Planctomycetes bacterium]|nr:diguanylate cyclase [Planctomycetota bacterium]
MALSRKSYYVLAVDDEPNNLEILSRRLTRQEYEVGVALSAAEAAAELDRRVPDLILLDINMPTVNGIELLRRLRAAPRTHTLPIIMVSALTDTENIVTALHEGANDYVTKPINLPVLLARMETQLRMAALVMHLETQGKLLATLAAMDHLTGVYNRRSMGEAFEVERSRSRRSGRPLSLLMLDLDHFKRVNDTHGHAAGDQVLKEFTVRLRDAVRAPDIIGRHGGEEFVILLPETEEPAALLAAERVRTAIASAPFPIEKGAIPVTASIGVVAVPPEYAGTFEEALAGADQALYRAKEGGRNCVRFASQLERGDTVVRPHS